MKNGCLCVMLALLTALLQPGCSGGGKSALPPLPELIEVSGEVTRAGKPLENVFVKFVPESGDENAASGGVTDAQGKFTLSYQQRAPGAIAGRHLVEIGLADADGDPSLVPARYQSRDTSGLTADISAGAENQFKFDLK